MLNVDNQAQGRGLVDSIMVCRKVHPKQQSQQEYTPLSGPKEGDIKKKTNNTVIFLYACEYVWSCQKFYFLLRF